MGTFSIVEHGGEQVMNRDSNFRYLFSCEDCKYRTKHVYNECVHPKHTKELVVECDCTVCDDWESVPVTQILICEVR